MTNPGRNRIQLLATFAASILMRCLLVAVAMAASGVMPSVARSQVSESESPFETDGESLELALPGATHHDPRRDRHQVNRAQFHRDRCKLANARYWNGIVVSGHCLPNGHSAPLRC